MSTPCHSLIAIHAIVFLDVLSFGIILPLLPHYALQLGATGVWVGALATAYSLAQLAGAPALGRLSDQVGRKPVLLAALAGSALSLVLTGVAHSLALLLVGRALAGAFGGSIATAQAYVADVTAPDARARHLGTLGAAIGLGFVVGPAIGAGLSPFGLGTAALVAASLSAVTFLYACATLQESRWAAAEHPGVGDAAPPDCRTAPPVPDGGPPPVQVRPLLVATFLVTCAFVAVEVTLALLANARFGLGPAGLGIVFGFLGLVIVASRAALGPLAARFGERRLAAGGSLAMGIALAALPAAPGFPAAMLALAIVATGQGLAAPTLSTLLSRARGVNAQGAILGTGQAMASAARAAGPIAAGLLYDVDAALPYVAAAGLAALAAWQIAAWRGPAAPPALRHA